MLAEVKEQQRTERSNEIGMMAQKKRSDENVDGGRVPTLGISMPTRLDRQFILY